jgi:hypothetical protein
VRIRHTLLAVPVAALALSALAPAAVAAAAADRAGGPPLRTYEITIDNLTVGQWFTPAVVGTHRRAVDVFEVGAPASFEVKEVAENGNLEPLVTALSAEKHVSDVVVAASPSGPPPIAPGGSVTFEIVAGPGARVLSWVSMLICTNDGFTGLDSIALPQVRGTSVSLDAVAYDAGTELNTERFADLVPPCPQLTGFGDQGGTGSSDPALAEGGVVRHHGGITGDHDLVPAVHGWTGPVASVEVTRVG